MQEKGEKSQNQMIEFYHKHKKFCEMSKKCFQTIEKRYHIKVNTREVRLIYQIITSKIDIKLWCVNETIQCVNKMTQCVNEKEELQKMASSFFGVKMAFYQEN